jgi:uroporphyrinogen-III synthase
VGVEIFSIFMRNIYLFSTSPHPDAISINSLEISFLHPHIDFSNYDYLIITSKQAINALKQYSNYDYQTTKALCISNATAKASKDAGIELLEVGQGYGDKLTDIIKKYPKSTRWLYLRAEVVASDFVQICQDEGYLIDEQIVYKSKCSQQIKETKISQDAILIFTSPSAVKCFLKYHTFSKKHFCIVIGKTTAKTLPKEIPYTIASEPTILACIELAKTK